MRRSAAISAGPERELPLREKPYLRRLGFVERFPTQLEPPKWRDLYISIDITGTGLNSGADVIGSASASKAHELLPAQVSGTTALLAASLVELGRGRAVPSHHSRTIWAQAKRRDLTVNFSAVICWWSTPSNARLTTQRCASLLNAVCFEVHTRVVSGPFSAREAPVAQYRVRER